MLRWSAPSMVWSSWESSESHRCPDRDADEKCLMTSEDTAAAPPATAKTWNQHEATGFCRGENVIPGTSPCDGGSCEPKVRRFGVPMFP